RRARGAAHRRGSHADRAAARRRVHLAHATALERDAIRARVRERGRAGSLRPRDPDLPRMLLGARRAAERADARADAAARVALQVAGAHPQPIGARLDQGPVAPGELRRDLPDADRLLDEPELLLEFELEPV